MPFKKVFLMESFAGSATNIGSGMIGVYYFGAPISPDLEAERAILQALNEK